MNSLRSRSATLSAMLLCGALALGGCGSGGTQTVSVSNSSTPSGSGSTSPTGTSKTTTSTPSTTTTGTNTSEQGSGQVTRTSSEPAFTKEAVSNTELGAALALVKAHGYSTNETSVYHPSQTLRVLVGIRSGSGDGYGQQAFFFVDNRYIGTDTSEPSATVKVVSQDDTEVTLAYPLYKPHDPLCCASGGQKTVRFQLNNGHLVALDQIPPANSQTGLSRN